MIPDTTRIIGIQSVELTDDCLDLKVVLSSGEIACTYWPISLLRKSLGVIADERASAATVN